MVEELEETKGPDIMAETISVLIVEDHAVTRDGLCANFEKAEDIQVVGSTGDFSEALEIAKRMQPQVVLLDLHLPGNQGPRALVLAFREFPDSKLVIFSGEERPAIIEAVLEAGAHLFVPKSEPAAKVADLIRELVRGQVVTMAHPVTQAGVKLSPGEKNILHLLAKGYKYNEIAQERFTSPDTVRKQCEILQLKLQLDSRERLIAWSVNNGFGTLDNDSK